MTLLSKKLKTLALSQKELAARVGVSQPYISDVLNGKILKMSATKKFSEAFGFELMELLSDFDKQQVDGLKKANENYKNTNQIIDNDRIKWIETTRISKNAGFNLVHGYFASSFVDQLEKSKIEIDSTSSGKYYEIEYNGDSMNDGTKTIVNADWFLALDIKREKWNNIKINTEWNVFYFLHNDLGHFLAEISSHGKLGELKLKFWNKNKVEYPDLVVNVKDCYIIAKITHLIRRKI